MILTRGWKWIEIGLALDWLLTLVMFICANSNKLNVGQRKVSQTSCEVEKTSNFSKKKKKTISLLFFLLYKCVVICAFYKLFKICYFQNKDLLVCFIECFLPGLKFTNFLSKIPKIFINLRCLNKVLSCNSELI